MPVAIAGVGLIHFDFDIDDRMVISMPVCPSKRNKTHVASARLTGAQLAQKRQAHRR